MRRSYFQDWFFYVTVWTSIITLISYSYLLFSRVLIDYLNVKELIENDPVAAYLVSDYQLMEGILFGVLYGTFFFFINLAVDYTDIHKLSFGTIVILKTLFYSLASVLVFLLIYSIIFYSGLYPPEVLDPDLITEFLSPEFILFMLMFLVLSTILINFIVQINKKFGPGNLIKMFLGRYHKPRIENRIFLFIDLKDSTTIAEKLGHIKYSRFIQSAFMDMNASLRKYRGEIYQYVGDEAVITWPFDKGMRNLNCIRYYFSFINHLNVRSGFYNKKFGRVPEFKAGLHAGNVTVAEVGMLKREIAYHGDVINTASRIQDLCNQYGKYLLASRAITDLIPKNDQIRIIKLGKIQLKGKANEEEIYSIEI